eukprot:TRINITY_DN98_c0_g1_i1.p1 TRINITY_DN98_c0_g1~~TRINITY_DN98_c0_g1_i1.p1  ORF type:complete len:161 (+),score=85.55 TRINITY_DN98_c0_g1_i1:53-484(+)
MKIAIVFFALVAVALAVSQVEEHRISFSLWKSFHSKKYESVAEEEYRFTVWRKNLLEAEAHNADPSNTFTRGINQFSDMTFNEIQASILGRKPSAERNLKVGIPESDGVLPTSWDWRVPRCRYPSQGPGQLRFMLDLLRLWCC